MEHLMSQYTYFFIKCGGLEQPLADPWKRTMCTKERNNYSDERVIIVQMGACVCFVDRLGENLSPPFIKHSQ